MSVTTDELYKVIDLFYKQENILYNHQHNSFNQFIDEGIHMTLSDNDNTFFSKETEKYKYNYKFKFENVIIRPPMIENENELMFPADARLYNFNYFSKLIADVTQIQEKINVITNEKEEKIIGDVEKKYHVTNIPIMVRSKYCSLNIKRGYDNRECDYDPGGYFIINGNEKVVISLERIIDNKPVVFIKKEQSNKIFTVQVNSKEYTTGNMQIFSIRMKKPNMLVMKIQQFNEMSVFTLIRAMGVDTDKDIVNYISNDPTDIEMINLIRQGLDNAIDDDGNKIMTTENAINYMVDKIKGYKKYSETNAADREVEKRIHLMNIFKNDILPHMGNNVTMKVYYICNMLQKLYNCHLGRKPIGDRDSFTNKRIDTPGVLLDMLFKQYFKKMLNDCGGFFKKRNNDDEKPLNIIGQIKPNTIEQGLKSALLTGSWGGSKSKKGVAQVLGRLSFLKTIADLRRVSSPNTDASTSRLTSPRHLHNSQYGFICPVETPEGAHVGLVKSLAHMSTITKTLLSQVHIIKNILKGNIVLFEDIHPYHFKDYVKVLLNGTWLGLTKKPFDLVEMLTKRRSVGDIEKTVSIVFTKREKQIKIYCDGGRIYRPLLCVKNNEILLTKKMIKEININSNKGIYRWNDLLSKHPDIIDYVDVEEAEETMIAMYPDDVDKMKNVMMKKYKDNELTKINRYNKDDVFVRYTHCELHPSMMLGLISSTVPFCDHNQSPRNIYQFSHAKQAMGLYTSSYRHRFDISNVLYNPETPLVATRSAKYMNTDKLAGGENIVVAVLSYSGYNQEDSVIVNQSAIERGLLRSASYAKYPSIIAKNPSTSQDDIFTKPDKSKVIGTKSGSYEKLNIKGYIEEETPINSGDVIIGKISPIPPTENGKIFKDSSVIYKPNVPAVIDKVWTGIYNNEGYEMYKVRVRAERVPMIGDKFSSRHGQKGTIGVTFRQEDMPFTKEGITPDLLINPHAFPGRMTIGQLIECVTGKVSACKGYETDGTPFNKFDINKVMDELEELGYNRTGKEYLYNGMTGKKMEAMIFIGPTYYQRLKHLVADKIHSRARGPKQLLTRQPPEGRSRDGGLRFGEMERDCMIAHGMGQFLKERMVETSDLYTTYVCDSCGFIAQQMIKKPGVYYCKQCNNSTDVSKINTTYAFKLLTQELMSMNIAPRIRVKKDIYNDI